MRVALVLEHFDPPRGGLERWTWQFAGEILRRGHEVHVVAKQFCRQSESLPIVAHPVADSGSRLEFAEAAQAELLSLSPDVIHDMGAGIYCDVLHPHGGPWEAVSEHKLRCLPGYLRPIKRSIDRLLPRHRESHELMARQYVDRGQLLVALSRRAAADFQTYHRVPAERIRIVYNGVDTEQFSPAHRSTYRRTIRRELGIDDRAVLALIVAHNFRLKGVPTLLRAMRRLKKRHRHLHLAVVGGKRLGSWQWMAQRMGVGSQVTFVGPKDETVPYYAAADMYVHPTIYDMCSLVVLEAVASGLPVITTTVNGVSELLEDGVEGRLIGNPTDADDLAEQMHALMDESLRREMGEAARAMALRHTLDRNVEEILAVYREAMPTARSLARHCEVEA